MLYSDSCWMKDICKKYQKENAPCRYNDSYCTKLFKLDKLFNLSYIPMALRKYQMLVLDEDLKDKQSFDTLKAYEASIEKFVNEGRNIYIYSNICGNGKTAWALRLAQMYLYSIWHKCDLECKVLFISVPRYLSSIKDGFTAFNEYATYIKDNIYNADMVIFDDIATKPATQFEADCLFTIIDSRMNESKSNIFTSNLSPKYLTECVGPRISSRILQYSENIEFVGQDKRFLKFSKKG